MGTARLFCSRLQLSSRCPGLFVGAVRARLLLGALLAALVLLAELGYKCGVRISAVLVALALLFAAFNLTDNHRIRQAEGTANCGPSTFVPDAFRAWLQSRSVARDLAATRCS